MEGLSKAMVESAGGAVELALGLIGVMTLFLGLMKVAEAGGLLRILARLIRPLMVRLFPDVPPEHPAMRCLNDCLELEGFDVVMRVQAYYAE